MIKYYVYALIIFISISNIELLEFGYKAIII